MINWEAHLRNDEADNHSPRRRSRFDWRCFAVCFIRGCADEADSDLQLRQSLRLSGWRALLVSVAAEQGPELIKIDDFYDNGTLVKTIVTNYGGPASFTFRRTG